MDSCGYRRLTTFVEQDNRYKWVVIRFDAVLPG